MKKLMILALVLASMNSFAELKCEVQTGDYGQVLDNEMKSVPMTKFDSTDHVSFSHKNENYFIHVGLDSYNPESADQNKESIYFDISVNKTGDSFKIYPKVTANGKAGYLFSKELAGGEMLFTGIVCNQ